MSSTVYTCYRWHGNTASLTDQRRGEPTTAVPPRMVADWARKPVAGDISRSTARSADEAIAWLREQTAPFAGKHRYPRTIEPRMTDEPGMPHQLVPEPWFESERETLTCGLALHWEIPLLGGMTLALAVLPGR